MSFIANNFFLTGCPDGCPTTPKKIKFMTTSIEEKIYDYFHSPVIKIGERNYLGKTFNTYVLENGSSIIADPRTGEFVRVGYFPPGDPKLQSALDAYHNRRAHIGLALIAFARLLKPLGWRVWLPREYRTEKPTYLWAWHPDQRKHFRIGWNEVPYTWTVKCLKATDDGQLSTVHSWPGDTMGLPASLSKIVALAAPDTPGTEELMTKDRYNLFSEV